MQDAGKLEIAIKALTRISKTAFAEEYYDGSSTSNAVQDSFRNIANEALSQIAAVPAIIDREVGGEPDPCAVAGYHVCGGEAAKSVEFDEWWRHFANGGLSSLSQESLAREGWNAADAALRAENERLRKVVEKLKKKLERREFYLREVGIKVPRYSKGD